MRHCGRYDSHSTFDLDHEINKHCERTKELATSINEVYTEEESKAILKAMAQTLIDQI